MGLPDILSNEEMSALEAQSGAGGSAVSFDFSGGLPDILSQSEMSALEGQSSGSSNKWNLVDSGKQLLSGGAEGVTNLLGFLADANPINLLQGRNPVNFENSKFVQGINETLLPAKEDKYHAERTIGNFIGGSLLGPGGMLGKVASGVSAGTGQLAGEALTDENTLAGKLVPMGLSVLGGAAPSVLSGAGKSIWKALTPATQSELKGSAATAFKEATGLAADDIARAMSDAPSDNLSKFATTAELTKNAGAAQLEKTLSNTDEAARIYTQRGLAREAAREGLIDNMSPITGVNKEALGSELIKAADETKTEMAKNAEIAWSAVPRNVEIDVSAQQNYIKSILENKQGGLMPKGDAKTLLSQFIDKKSNALTSGALQDIRSDALALLRDRNLTPIETRTLGALQSSIDDAMKNGLTGAELDTWKDARGLTKQTAETFSRGTAGGSLLSDFARPSNVLANAIKGDSASIKQLKAAIAENPGLIEDVKRGFLDSIPRDAQGRLTPNNMKKFLAANDGAVKELLGEEHYGSLNRILEDLRSEASVSELAFKASKGNSVTAQRGTVAGTIDKLVVGSITPGVGPIAMLVDNIKQSVGVKNAQEVKDLLFKAALDPEFAIELAAAPTKTRIYTTLERLSMAVKDASVKGGTAGIVSMANNDAETPAPATARQLTAAAPEQKKATAQLPIGPQPQPKGQPQKAKVPYLSPDDKFLNTLLDSIRQVESGGNDKAISPAGAKGPYQFTDATAKDYGLEDPFDPEASRGAAASKILDDWEKFGDLRLALAAYNAGAGRVGKLLKRVEGDSYDDIAHLLPAETKAYVPKIEKVFAKLMG